MKITVEVSENELRKIKKLTGENKKGPAIRKLIERDLMMERRREIVNKFVTGEWGVELKGWEESQEREREEAQRMSDAWNK